MFLSAGTGITVSNGGLNAPLIDMAKYLAFLMSDGSNPLYETVLKRSSLDEMWKPQIRAADGEGATGSDAHAGLSFFIERYGDVEMIGHSGNQNGFLSHLYIHRQSHTAYVIAFNTDVNRGSDSVTRQVDAVVRDAILREVIRHP